MKYWRRGSGSPILFLHGIPTSGRLWDYVVQQLEGNFECVIVDLPGLGESPPLADGSRDPSRIAEELDALRVSLRIPAWHLVGHDAGATIAIHYATKHPERLKRLALLAPPMFAEFRLPWFFRLLRIPLIGDLVAPLIVLLIWNGGIQSIVTRDDVKIEGILADFRKPFRGWRGARRLAWLVRWGNPCDVLGQTAALLPKIATPTMVIHGRRDGAIPVHLVQKAAATIPNARLFIFDTGHFLPLNAPEPLCEHLHRFLTEDVSSTTSNPGSAAS